MTALLTVENQQRVTNFLATHTEFHPGRDPLVLTPADGGDGFFASEILRKSD